MGRPTAWFTAVEDVTLELRQGETIGLVGESGSGKTTLARLILRLIRPSEGTVYYGDLDVTNASRKELIAFRQEAQIIFQNPIGSLDPEMRVEEIVAEGMPHLEWAVKRGDIDSRAARSRGVEFKHPRPVSSRIFWRTTAAT